MLINLQQRTLERPSRVFQFMEAVSTNGCDEGTLLKVFEHLKEDADYEKLSIDSTTVKAHQSGSGTKKRAKDYG